MEITVLPPEEKKYFSHVIYPNTFSPEECKKIINFSGVTCPAAIYTEDQNSYYRNPEARSHLLKPLNYNKETFWMFERLKKIVLDINKDYFKFNINSILETILLEYNVGDFFTMHSDIGNGLPSTRKITMVTLLSDKSEYEGGGVTWLPEFPSFEFNHGDTVIFPAYILHGISKVTKGKRFTLETIVHGPPFR